MTTTTASKGGRASAGDYRTELLDRLGLGPDANDQEIESAHRTLTGFLEDAPETLADWAHEELAKADEAYALLSGPDSVLQAAARERYAATVRARVASTQSAAPAAATSSSRLPWILLAAVVVVALVVGVWWMGRPSVPEMTAADTAATASAAPTMDQAKLAELTAKVQADPKDVASLKQIADLYFGVGDYKNATTFTQKVLEITPKDKGAMLALGAAQFNQGDATAAEKTWTDTAALYPDDQEVHYDLGFLYMTTGKTEQMQAEWAKVMEIDPNSELAKTVSSHIGTAPSASPSN